MEQKENEVADLASAFGVVKNKAAKQPEKTTSSKSKANVRNDSDVKKVITALQLASDNKKNSTTDDRFFPSFPTFLNAYTEWHEIRPPKSFTSRANQRTMNSLEQMMQAIHDMIRSLLNIRSSQLRSNVSMAFY